MNETALRLRLIHVLFIGVLPMIWLYGLLVMKDTAAREERRLYASST